MDLVKLAQQNPDTMITVRLSDLLDANRQLIKEANGSPDTEYMTVQEVAALFKVSVKNIYRWRDSGYLVPVKVGRQLRYKASEVHAKFASSKV